MAASNSGPKPFILLCISKRATGKGNVAQPPLDWLLRAPKSLSVTAVVVLYKLWTWINPSARATEIPLPDCTGVREKDGTVDVTQRRRGVISFPVVDPSDMTFLFESDVSLQDISFDSNEKFMVSGNGQLVRFEAEEGLTVLPVPGRQSHYFHLCRGEIPRCVYY